MILIGPRLLNYIHAGTTSTPKEMTDNFADDLFIGGNDEDYEFFSILQEYDEQFVDEPSGFLQADTFSCRAKTQEDTKPTDNPPKHISVKSVFTQPQDKKFIEVFEFANFNPLQSRCFDILYNKDINIVVSGNKQHHLKHFPIHFRCYYTNIFFNPHKQHPQQAARQPFSRLHCAGFFATALQDEPYTWRR